MIAMQQIGARLVIPVRALHCSSKLIMCTQDGVPDAMLRPELWDKIKRFRNAIQHGEQSGGLCAIDFDDDQSLDALLKVARPRPFPRAGRVTVAPESVSSCRQPTRNPRASGRKPRASRLTVGSWASISKNGDAPVFCRRLSVTI